MFIFYRYVVGLNSYFATRDSSTASSSTHRAVPGFAKCFECLCSRLVPFAICEHVRALARYRVARGRWDLKVMAVVVVVAVVAVVIFVGSRYFLTYVRALCACPG